MFLNIEQATEEQNWETASKELEEIAIRYQRARPYLRLYSNTVDVENFERSLARIRTAIELEEATDARMEIASARIDWRDILAP